MLRIRRPGFREPELLVNRRVLLLLSVANLHFAAISKTSGHLTFQEFGYTIIVSMLKGRLESILEVGDTAEQLMSTRTFCKV